MNMMLKNKECQVRFEEYADNNNVAIMVVKPKKGRMREEELVTTATVNTDTAIKPDFVAIKGWSENTGIEQALIDADVICPERLGAIRCGMAVAYVYELTPTAKKAKKNQQ